MIVLRAVVCVPTCTLKICPATLWQIVQTVGAPTEWAGVWLSVAIISPFLHREMCRVPATRLELCASLSLGLAWPEPFTTTTRGS